MLLVYTHKITPRLSYIFKHFFVRILQIPVTFTTRVDEFVAHNGPKITYSRSPLGSEFFIHSHDLLFDQGINESRLIRPFPYDVSLELGLNLKNSLNMHSKQICTRAQLVVRNDIRGGKLRKVIFIVALIF